MGPVMVDVEGLELNEEDRERLRHPLVGGVILFARNYASSEQLRQLTKAIRALKNPELLIAVDHEGGRVQRFRDGFTAIPPMRAFGRLWDRDPARATELIKQTGYVIGAELLAHGVDFSFAPVMDLDHGESSVIGDRSFHRDPAIVTSLARELIGGFAEAGMGWVGKHFPGHGYVRADSHHEVPIDPRPYTIIERDDLVPFRDLARLGMGGMMPAHVIYPDVDALPAGFSPIWLKTVLRESLGFDGVIFSDDLSMKAATTAGGVAERAATAIDAGCDMVLLCNDGPQADELLTGLSAQQRTYPAARIDSMRSPTEWRTMALNDDRQYAACLVSLSRETQT
ncbi:MAG: beta-N-acetylhexosaminidase [Pseudomonadota bacterium]|nr:beta-N-acetylhexosaminidase [Pseudomonadota bacterium]